MSKWPQFKVGMVRTVGGAFRPDWAPLVGPRSSAGHSETRAGITEVC